MSTLLVSALTANFAQSGAALSAFLGIMEPAMYGVNLKYKRPHYLYR